MKAIDPHTNPREPDLKTVSTAERSAEHSAFLKHIANTTGTISYAQLAVLYPAICQAAMEWLLVEKKSVDLGFLILHPQPHRANWKQIMLALFPTLGPTLLGKPRLVKDALLTSSGFKTKMLSGELLAVAGERFVVWGVDVELKRPWWKAMFRHEGAKLSALGSVQYATYTAKQIVALRPKSLRAYLSFLRQVSYPCAKIQQSRVYRRSFIVPFVPKGRVRPVAAGDIPVHRVVARAPEELATPTLKEVVLPDAGVPSLPDFQPGDVDLRLSLGPTDTID